MLPELPEVPELPDEPIPPPLAEFDAPPLVPDV
jgi:hypothetical protein